MNIQQIMEATQFKISGGSKYQWSCFGDNARYIDFSIEGENEVVSLVFDSVNQTIYQVEFFPNDTTTYSWINPEFIDALKKEHSIKNIPFNNEESNRIINIEVEDDIIDKITSFFNTGTFDDRVLTILELTSEEEELIEKASSISNLSVNDFINEAIKDYIKKHIN